MNPPSHSGICAQVFFGFGEPFELRRFEIPELGAAELLVRIDLAAICGSDLHTLAGTRTEPTPCVLGHEGVGTIVAVGPGAGIEVGTRVTWTLADSCGRCQRCTRDHLPQKCDRLFKYGHASLADGSGLNGTFASHIVLRAGTTVVPIPDRVSAAMAVSANCALATMVAAWRAVRASVAEVDSVVIQGAGLQRAAAGLPVEFVGPVSDRVRLATMIASADAVISTGPHETFGLAALEALACGTPIVANPAGALRELLVIGAGVVAGRTAEGFADALSLVLLADREVQRCVARERAEQFGWDRAGTAFLELYQGLIEGSSSKSSSSVPVASAHRSGSDA